MKILLINLEENGLTSLEILQRRIPAAPKSYLAQLLKSGKVLLEQTPASAATVLKSGDRLLLPESKRLKELFLATETMAVDILLETSLALVVLKPAGLAVHGSVGHEGDNLCDRVQALLKRRRDPFRASPVHRLDVGTSGPVMFAKGRKAAGLLGRVMMDGKMEKMYFALAKGRFQGEDTSGVMARGTDTPSEGLLISSIPAKGKLKEATSRYLILAGTDDLTLLRLELISGRTHQIRRQMAEAGHPLVGDLRYGGPELPDLARPFLHCFHLAWPDPITQNRQQVTCPLPSHLSKILTAAGLPTPE
ncbi:MAG: RluA family pseudouridine synthase [Syntrophotaleaceae bacterium]